MLSDEGPISEHLATAMRSEGWMTQLRLSHNTLEMSTRVLDCTHRFERVTAALVRFLLINFDFGIPFTFCFFFLFVMRSNRVRGTVSSPATPAVASTLIDHGTRERNDLHTWRPLMTTVDHWRSRS